MYSSVVPWWVVGFACGMHAKQHETSKALIRWASTKLKENYRSASALCCLARRFANSIASVSPELIKKPPEKVANLSVLIFGDTKQNHLQANFKMKFEVRRPCLSLSLTPNARFESVTLWHSPTETRLSSIVSQDNQAEGNSQQNAFKKWSAGSGSSCNWQRKPAFNNFFTSPLITRSDELGKYCSRNRYSNYWWLQGSRELSRNIRHQWWNSRQSCRDQTL